MATITLPDETTAYTECRQTMQHTIRRFITRYGGDPDDYESLADELFIKLHRKFNEGCAGAAKSFKSWFAYKLNFALLDFRRKQLDEPVENLEEITSIATPCPTFGRRSYCTGLPADGRYIVMLVVDTPEQLEAKIKARGGQFQNYRSCIREYLRDEKGWGHTRIKSAMTVVSMHVQGKTNATD